MRAKYPFLYLVLASALAAVVLLLMSTVREKPSISHAVLSRDRVALIDISGMITTSRGPVDGTISSQNIIELLEKYADDDSVKALVLRINSPGGTVVASQEVYAALNRLRQEKDKAIVVSMADITASGGYYISCAADWILANPGTITGSIGVIMEFPNMEGLLGKVGVTTVTVKSGEFKDTGSAFREMTKEEREILQELVDDVYSQFVTAVEQGRGMSRERVQSLADGRIFSGKRAKNLGLVDEMGDLETAIMKAAELSGIKGKPEVVREKKKTKIWDYLGNRISVLRVLSPSIINTGSTQLLYLWK